MARMDAKLKSKVIAALMAGETVTSVAKAYALDKATVSRLKSGLTTTELQQISTEKKESLTELIEEHLRASLAGAVKIAEQANNEQWRNDQPAGELAIFYGVLSDKACRIIEVAGHILTPKPDQFTESILELPAADFASDLDIQAETFKANSESVG